MLPIAHSSVSAVLVGPVEPHQVVAMECRLNRTLMTKLYAATGSFDLVDR